MKPIPLNTNWKHHLWLGSAIAFWLLTFLVVVAPFDTADLSLALRFQLLPPYGLLFLLAYAIAVGLQNLAYARWNHWTALGEVAIVLLTYCLSLVFCFAYYKTDIINGTYSFRIFLKHVFVPTVLLASFLMVGGRWYLNHRERLRRERIARTEVLSLRGDNRQDVLRLLPADLLYVKAAQNYAEIHFLKEGKPQKQLLRTTLGKLERRIPNLLRVHRSYLVNPRHFVRWKEGGVAQIGGAEIPVSKSYRTNLETSLDIR